MLQVQTKAMAGLAEVAKFFWGPLVCAGLLLLTVSVFVKSWFHVSLLTPVANCQKMASKLTKFTFKKKQVEITNEEVIQLDSDSDFADLDLLTTDNTDSDNDFKKISSFRDDKKRDQENWKQFMEQARKPKLSPEKRKEAQDKWKGLMSTMQKNQRARSEEPKKRTAKRQVGAKRTLANPNVKRLKVEEKVEVVTVEEICVSECLSSESTVCSTQNAKPLHPIFLQTSSKSNIKVVNENSEVKPWDLVHSDNPWLCDDSSYAEPEIVHLNESTVNIEPESGKTKSCPFYKKLPGTKFSVDAFNYGVIPGIDVYLLSHFHLDHYQGLTKKFSKTLICSIPTGNLVKMKLGVADDYIRKLELNKVYLIQGVEVVLIDANHCPGSVMFLLKLPNGTQYLHTGDFRFTPEMLTNRFLRNIRVDCLYLDTTYCDPRYTFPTQPDAISHAIVEVQKHLTYRPKTLVLCGTYCIGKERVFCAIADALGSKVFCGYEKRRVIGAMENPYFQQLLSLNEKQCRVHVVSMQNLNAKFLSEYLTQRPEYTNIFAIRPTGWEFSKASKGAKVGTNLRSMCNDTVTMLGVPYSEHSSFAELREFVSTLRPIRVQPTVNVGSAPKREAMMGHIDTWLGTKLS